MVLQIVAGGLAAVAVTAKFYWRRLLRLVGRRRGEQEPSGRNADPPAGPATSPDERARSS